MIYCVSGMDFDEFLQDYSAIVHAKDVVIFERGVIGRMDLDAELSGESALCRRLALFSRDKLIVLLAAIRTFTGDTCFNSVLTVDCGKIVGIADEIHPVKGYEAGTALRVFDTSLGGVGVILGADIFYPQLWSKLLPLRARYLFYLDARPTEYAAVNMAQALAISSGRSVVMQFSDQCLFVDNDGAVAQIEQGKLRPIARRAARREPFLQLTAVKTVVEHAD